MLAGIFRNVRNGLAHVSCSVVYEPDKYLYAFECTGLDVHIGFQDHRKWLHSVIGMHTDKHLKTKHWPSTFHLVLGAHQGRQALCPEIKAAVCFLIECGFTSFKDGDSLMVRLAANGEVIVLKMGKFGTGRPTEVASLGNYFYEKALYDQMTEYPGLFNADVP